MNILYLGGILVLGSLLLVSVANANGIKLQAVDPAIHLSLDNPDPAAPVQGSGAGWWDRAKRTLQSLTPCGLGSATIAFALLGGAVSPLGLFAAGVMIFVCL